LLRVLFFRGLDATPPCGRGRTPAHDCVFVSPAFGSHYFYWGGVSVGVAAAPILVVLLGVARGLVCALSCFTFSLILIELILFHLDRVPFTSSYLPGRRPLIETTLRYRIAAVLYIAIPGSIVFGALQSVAWSIGLNLGLILVWQGIRYLRQTGQVTTRLEFEELPEIAVQVLAIDRD
jgi:hypothetical protein